MSRRTSRNTPTCVGKTEALFSSHHPHKKHPHVRGADSREMRNQGKDLETPPRAWGRLFFFGIRIFAVRNTPTCVGKTHHPAMVGTCGKKHPHVRGEDTSAVAQQLAEEETPPRAWGRRRIEKSPLAEKGNTPTCVGKTQQSSSDEPRKGKHPHVRGEDPHTPEGVHDLAETPPRAWGRLSSPLVSSYLH